MEPSMKSELVSHTQKVQNSKKRSSWMLWKLGVAVQEKNQDSHFRGKAGISGNTCFVLMWSVSKAKEFQIFSLFIKINVKETESGTLGITETAARVCVHTYTCSSWALRDGFRADRKTRNDIKPWSHVFLTHGYHHIHAGWGARKWDSPLLAHSRSCGEERILRRNGKLKDWDEERRVVRGPQLQRHFWPLWDPGSTQSSLEGYGWRNVKSSMC